MNCPVCQAEMEDGYLQGDRMIAWLKKSRKVSLFPGEGEIMLENNLFGGFLFHASICKSCRKIVVDYSDKEIREGYAY